MNGRSFPPHCECSTARLQGIRIHVRMVQGSSGELSNNAKASETSEMFQSTATIKYADLTTRVRIPAAQLSWQIESIKRGPVKTYYAVC